MTIGSLLPGAVQHLKWVIAPCFLIYLALMASCSSKPTSNESDDTPAPAQPPGDYPDIPKPTSPLDLDLPMESDTFVALFPIADKDVDFVPVISNGTFNWDVDIQTQYVQRCLIGCPSGVTEIASSDPPGDYYNGSRRFSNMVFEGGVVNLTDPKPFGETKNAYTGTLRIVFVENGQAVQPRSPYRNDCWFDWWGQTADKRVTPCLFAGYHNLPVELGFLDVSRVRHYYVAAKSCGMLTTPVYVKRYRFWERVLIDGKKSILVDPGNTFTVSYERTEGVSITESEEFARALDLDLSLEIEVITASLGQTLTETVSREVQVTEETTVTTSRQVEGIAGKTVVYSVWRSVEHYSITDSLGNPYTDVDFAFSDLGFTRIVGEYEWLSSAEFPK